MQSSVVVLSDIKALLTLWLLKTGATSAEIRTSQQLAAATRVMVNEDQMAGRSDTRPATSASNASNIATFYPNSDVEIAARKVQLLVEATSSDVMAMLTLALLKVGASSDEMQRALHLAALARAREEHARSQRAAGKPDMTDPLGSSSAFLPSAQAAVNEFLTPAMSKVAASA